MVSRPGERVNDCDERFWRPPPSGRKAVVGRFPYLVLYREDAGELLVVSVFHTSRDPVRWQSRVE